MRLHTEYRFIIDVQILLTKVWMEVRRVILCRSILYQSVQGRPLTISGGAIHTIDSNDRDHHMAYGLLFYNYQSALSLTGSLSIIALA